MGAQANHCSVRKKAYARFIENRKFSVIGREYEGASRGTIHLACLHIHVLSRALSCASTRRDVKARHFVFTKDTKEFSRENLKGEKQYEKDDDSCDDGGVRAGRRP